MSHFDISSWTHVYITVANSKWNTQSHTYLLRWQALQNLFPACSLLRNEFLGVYCTLHGRKGMFFWYQKELIYFGIEPNEHFLYHLNIYPIEGRWLLFIYLQGDTFSAGGYVDLSFLDNLFWRGIVTWFSSSLLWQIVLLTCLSVGGIVCLLCWRIVIRDFIFGSPLFIQS